MSLDALARRDFLAGSAAFGATLCLPGRLSAADGRKTFTILHTNDMHSAFIGMGPSADYTPFKLHDDSTRGGFARLAGLIAQRKAADRKLGPVLVLVDDAGQRRRPEELLLEGAEELFGERRGTWSEGRALSHLRSALRDCRPCSMASDFPPSLSNN